MLFLILKNIKRVHLFSSLKLIIIIDVIEIIYENIHLLNNIHNFINYNVVISYINDHPILILKPLKIGRSNGMYSSCSNPKCLFRINFPMDNLFKYLSENN